MHKLYLTKQECEAIRNSEIIVNDLGGFPAMEGGTLLKIDISKSPTKEFRYCISFHFDIEGWLKCVEYLNSGLDPKHKIIKLQFDGVFDYLLQREDMNPGQCGDIYFSNDQSQHARAALPEIPLIIPGPFCNFHIREGMNTMLRFSEEECTISAEYVED